MALSEMNRSRSSIETVALFAIGFGLFMFTRRSEVFPTIQAMIVIAPIFILRFSRTLPLWRAITLTILGFVLSMNIALWGLFDISDPLAGLAFNTIRSTMLALLYALPYLIDRVLYQRFGPSLWSVLAFPAVVTAMLFLSSIEGPFDGTSAKTVFAYGPIELKQLYALTGLWGFIFLWSLPAALVNHAWARRFEMRATVMAILVMALVGVGTYGYGAYRLNTADQPDRTRVAAIVLLPEDGNAVSMEPFFSSKRVLPYDQTLARIESLTAESVAQGANLVTFQELAVTVMEPDIEKVRADYQRIAKQNAVWLSITYSWYATSDDEKGNNVHLLIDDQGRILAHYDKRYLFGFGSGGETSVFNKGPTVIQSVETPFGRVALSICRDMAFPSYARQAGQAGADIMLTPSYDFPKSNAPSDTGRAIENGFTNIRPTYNGVSYAIDPYGRILGQMDSGEGGSGIMLVEVSRGGIDTLYARWGDWFGWLNLAVTILLVCVAVFWRPAKSAYT
jgi:apolipoprotein N-acyltransferase